MNKRIRFMIIALHVIAALNLLLVLLLVMFAYRYMPSVERPEFIWKVAAVGVTLAIGAEIIAWALKKEKKWAWTVALILCCLYLVALLLPLGMVSVLGIGSSVAFVCKNGFIDCRGISLAELCKSVEMDCGSMQISLDINPARNEIQTFYIHIGDHVGPDRPESGAGRIKRPGTIHQYVFTGAPNTLTGDRNNKIAVRPEFPCTIQGRLEMSGHATVEEDIAPCKGKGFDVEVYGGNTYSINIKSDTPGEYSFTLLEMREDVQDFTLSIGDHVAPDKPASGAGRIETIGSRDRYTFTAEAGTKMKIQRMPPCNGKFKGYFLDPVPYEYKTAAGPSFMMTNDSNSDLRCSEPAFWKVNRRGTFTLTVSSDDLSGTGDYSFDLTLGESEADEIISIPGIYGKYCYKPYHYDTLVSQDLTVKVNEIVDLEIKNEQKVEKLVQVSANVKEIKAQAFRLCMDYRNGIATKETYAKQEEIISSWRKAAAERGK